MDRSPRETTRTRRQESRDSDRDSEQSRETRDSRDADRDRLEQRVGSVLLLTASVISWRRCNLVMLHISDA